jgi:hypothetical protein
MDDALERDDSVIVPCNGQTDQWQLEQHQRILDCLKKYDGELNVEPEVLSQKLSQTISYAVGHEVRITPTGILVLELGGQARWYLARPVKEGGLPAALQALRKDIREMQ